MYLFFFLHLNCRVISTENLDGRWFGDTCQICKQKSCSPPGHYQSIPVNTRYSINKYAEIYLDRIVCLHGVSSSIISYCGSQFTHELQTSQGTKHLNSAYHPQRDGQTERVNKILQDMLKHVSYTMWRVGANA